MAIYFESPSTSTFSWAGRGEIRGSEGRLDRPGRWCQRSRYRTGFVKIGFRGSLSRCWFKVYFVWRWFGRNLCDLGFGLFPGPFDEGFVAEGLASLGGVADSLDEGGVV